MVTKDQSTTGRLCHNFQAWQASKNLPPKAPVHPWCWLTLLWQRIHVDFSGPVMGKMLLVVTDAHSKWPEVQAMNSTTVSKTIEVLQELLGMGYKNTWHQTTVLSLCLPSFRVFCLRIE